MSENLNLKSIDELKSLFINADSAEIKELVKKELTSRKLKQLESEAEFEALTSSVEKMAKLPPRATKPKDEEDEGAKEDEYEDAQEDEDEDEDAKRKKKSKKSSSSKKSFDGEIETKSMHIDRKPDFAITNSYQKSTSDFIEEKALKHYGVIHKGLVNCYESNDNQHIGMQKYYEQKSSGDVSENLDIHAEVLSNVIAEDNAPVVKKMLADKLYCNSFATAKAKKFIGEYREASNTMRSMESTKSMYNTMVGTDGAALLNTTSQILYGKKWFIESTALNFTRIVPMVTRELRIVNFATRPTVSTVFEGQSTGGITSMGRVEAVSLKEGPVYHTMFAITNDIVKDGGAALVSRIAEECTAELARKLSFEVVAGDGGGDDKIQGFLTLPTVDVSSLSVAQQQETKIPGTNKIISNGAAVLDAEKLAYLKQAVNSSYTSRGRGAFIMNPATYTFLMLTKDDIKNYKFNRNDLLQYGPSQAEQITLRQPFGNAQVGIENNVLSVPQIWGTPVILDPYFPAVNSLGQGAGQIVVAYGNLEEYYLLGISAAAGFRAGIAGSAANGIVTAGLEFNTPFQAYVRASGKPVNTQAMAFLAM